MKFYKFNTLTELQKAIPEIKERIYFLAGGTDLLVYLKDGLISDDSCIVDIGNLKELCFIAESDGKIRIGALTTFSEIIKNEIINKHCKILSDSCKTIGSIQIRNRGTIGGNIANASPAGDSIPALFCLNAIIKTTSREIPITELFTGPKKTILENNELITEILVNRQEGFSYFYKLGLRKAFSISKVSIAITCLKTSENVLQKVNIACGAVAPTVIKASQTESLLEGKKLNDEIINEAVEKIRQEVMPIDDFRSNAFYRRHCIGILLQRGLREVLTYG